MPFVGSRLREAREAMDLTVTSLAEQLDISKQAVSKYERGVEPSAEMLGRLSEKLRVPRHFFFRRVEPYEETGILFWRSTNAATKRARVRAGRRFVWLRSITRYLSRFVQFPPLNMPKIDVPDDPTKLFPSDIECAALEARRHWGLGDGPISNVSWLLENKGVAVVRQDFDAPHMDAFSEWHPNRQPYVVLSSDKESACRSRFEAAHELAHLLLHRGVTTKQFNTKAIHAEMERQANLFASAFLLPAITFADSFYSTSLDMLVPLKSQWQVSIAAIVNRASQLSLLSEAEERRMWINLSRRSWRKREPLDDEIPPEQPRLLKRALDLVVGSGLAMPNEIAVHLGLSNRLIEEALGLEQGYLSETDRHLPLKEDAPDVIRFPGAAH